MGRRILSDYKLIQGACRSVLVAG